jgi:uncharacterized protein YecE (DUF72 family)
MEVGLLQSIGIAFSICWENIKNPLQQVYKGAKVTYAMFNNWHGGFAVKNALELQKEIQAE